MINPIAPKISVAIGVCTYKRIELLKTCCASLNEMYCPENISISLLIADNDPEASARSFISSLKNDFKYPIDYDVENGRGIPFARNNVLKRALSLGVSVLAFIDDDEWVNKEWMLNIWNHYMKSGTDVVHGHVITVYPMDAPGWVRQGGFYQRRNHPTGTVFNSASTNNVLFNLDKICRQWNLSFDESFGLRGGSDSDFFRRAHESGASISWCSTAIVYETLESDRFLISYLLKRKFRTRNSEIFFKSITFKKRGKLLVRACWKIISGIVILPFSPLLGTHYSVRMLSRIVEGFGRFLGVVGIHIRWNEYHGK